MTNAASEAQRAAEREAAAVERALVGFDEAEYLRYNPDVQAAVQSGRVPSGRHHYIFQGRFEARMGRPAQHVSPPASEAPAVPPVQTAALPPNPVVPQPVPSPPVAAAPEPSTPAAPKPPPPPPPPPDLPPVRIIAQPPIPERPKAEASGRPPATVEQGQTTSQSMSWAAAPPTTARPSEPPPSVVETLLVSRSGGVFINGWMSDATVPLVRLEIGVGRARSF